MGKLKWNINIILLEKEYLLLVLENLKGSKTKLEAMAKDSDATKVIGFFL